MLELSEEFLGAIVAILTRVGVAVTAVLDVLFLREQNFKDNINRWSGTISRVPSTLQLLGGNRVIYRTLTRTISRLRDLAPTLRHALKQAREVSAISIPGR